MILHGLGFPNFVLFAVFAAMRGLGRSMTWQPIRPQRRVALSTRRRLGLVMLGASLGWSAVGYAACVALGPLAQAISDAHTFQARESRAAPP